MKPVITERGWAGHFICSNSCLFRRNTLISFGRNKYVVSTVGAYLPEGKDSIETIGAGGRYYETMAFKAKKESGYWGADVSKEISFNSRWSICAESVMELPETVDNLANEMHDQVVKEISKTLKPRVKSD